jgi:hypothetical protein
MEITRTETVHSKSNAEALLRMEVKYHRESLPPLKSNPLVRPCRTPSLGIIRAVANRDKLLPTLNKLLKRETVFTRTCRLETACNCI